MFKNGQFPLGSLAGLRLRQLSLILSDFIRFGSIVPITDPR